MPVQNAVADKTTKGKKNIMARAVYNDPNQNARASNRYVEDGSYLRIKNVTIGYTIPMVLIKRAHLTTARLYFSAQNLLTLTKYSGFDPEVGVNGIDNNIYPVTKTFCIGINLGM